MTPHRSGRRWGRSLAVAVLACLALAGAIVAGTPANVLADPAAPAAPAWAVPPADGICLPAAPETCIDEAVVVLASRSGAGGGIAGVAAFYDAYALAARSDEGLWPGPAPGYVYRTGEHGCSYSSPLLVNNGPHGVLSNGGRAYDACVAAIEHEAAYQSWLVQTKAERITSCNAAWETWCVNVGVDPPWQELDPDSALCRLLPTLSGCAIDSSSWLAPAGVPAPRTVATGAYGPGEQIAEHFKIGDNPPDHAYALSHALAVGFTLDGATVDTWYRLAEAQYTGDSTMRSWFEVRLTSGGANLQMRYMRSGAYTGTVTVAYVPGEIHAVAAKVDAVCCSPSYRVSLFVGGPAGRAEALGVDLSSGQGAFHVLNQAGRKWKVGAGLPGVVRSFESWVHPGWWSSPQVTDAQMRTKLDGLEAGLRIATDPEPAFPELPALPEAPSAVPVPVEPEPAPEPQPAPEMTTIPPVTVATGEEGFFDKLGNRIGGFFDNLGSLIGSAFGWLGDLMVELLQTLLDFLDRMLRWLGDLIVWLGETLGDLLRWIGDLLGDIYDAIGVAAEATTEAITTMSRTVVDAIKDLADLLDRIVGAIGDLPGELWAWFKAGLQELFVPSGPVVQLRECDTSFPCSWVQELVDSFGSLGSTFEGAGSCTAPGIGWSQFKISLPPPSGCAAAAGSVPAVGAESAGDLFGYRVALRAAALVAFGLAFIWWVLGLTPWAERRHYEMHPTQQTLFD